MTQRISVLALGAATAAIAAAGGTVSFERNLGQTTEAYSYLARAKGQTVFFGPRDIGIELHGAGRVVSTVHMEFVGAPPPQAWNPVGSASGSTSYLLGNDPSKWISNVPRYERIERRAVYPGIDLAVYGKDGRIEYDLVLQANADPAKVRFRLRSQWPARALASGEIEVSTPAGVLRQRIPETYQMKAGVRTRVAGQFASTGAKNEFRLVLGRYDASLPLVVDPVIETASYLGGELDDQVVFAGQDYIVGNTSSVDFQGVTGNRRGRDIFLQFNGNIGIYSGLPFGIGTQHFIIGGSGDDEATTAGPFYSGVSLIQRNYNFVAIAGNTNSRDLARRIDGQPQQYRGGASDGFVLVFSLFSPYSPGVSIRGDYVGGSGDDRILGGMMLGTTMYLAGVTDSADLTASIGFQTALGGGKDGFAATYFISSTGDPTPYNLTYLGGTGDDSAWAIVPSSTLERSGYWVFGETGSPDFPWITDGSRKGPSDAFMTFVGTDKAGNRIDQTRLLGGSGEDGFRAIGVNSSTSLGSFVNLQSVLLAGITNSPDFPVTPGAAQQKLGGGMDAFALRFLPVEGEIPFVTLLGGSGDEEVTAAAIRSDGQFLVAGATQSADFPVVDAVQPRLAGGTDGFLASYTDAGLLQFSTYYGGTGHARTRSVTALEGGPIRIVGETTSPDLPGMAGASKDRQLDGFSANIGSAEIIAPSRMAVAKGGRMALNLQISQTSQQVQATVRSLDPGKVRIWSDGELFDEIRMDRRNISIAGMQDSGEAEIEVSMPGFLSRRIRISLYPAVLAIAQLPARLTLWSPQQTLNARYCALNRGLNRLEACGDSTEDLKLEWISSAPEVASPIPFQSYTGLQVNGRGSATISLRSEIPVFPAGGMTITVTAAAPTLPSRILLGKDLGIYLPVSSVNAIRAGADVKIRTCDPGKALVADGNGYAPWSQEYILKGGQYLNATVVASVGEGECEITMSSPDFDADISTVLEFRPSYLTSTPAKAFEGESGNVYLRMSFEGATPFRSYFNRPGAPPIELQLSSSNPAIAAPKETRVTLDRLQYNQLVFPFNAKAVGSASIEMTAISPPGLSIDGPAKIEVTVKPPAGLVDTPAEIRVGKDLQTITNFGRFNGTQLQGTYRVSVSDPAVAQLISNDALTSEYSSTQFPSAVTIVALTAGRQTSLVLRGPDGLQASVPVVTTPSGFGFNAIRVRATMRDTLPALGISSFALDPATGLPYAAQALRPGLELELAIRREGRSAEAAGSVRAIANASVNLPVGLRVLEPGSTVFTLVQPEGFTDFDRRSRVEVTVLNSNNLLNFSAAVRNALTQATVISTAPNQSFPPTFTPDPIRVESSDPSRLLISTSLSDPGAASIQTVRGQQFYLVGLASSGQASVRVTGSGFEPLEQVIPIEALVARINASPEVYSGTSTATVDVSLAGQSVYTLTALRAGVTITATLISSAPDIVSLEKSTLTMSGQNVSARTTLNAKSAGTANITMALPDPVAVLKNRVAVTVKRLRFTMRGQNSYTPPFRAAKDFMGQMQIAVENGLTLSDNAIVRVTSLDPGKLLVSRTSDGAPSAAVNLAFTVGSGGGGQSILVHALDSSGSAQVRLSADGFEDSLFTFNLQRATASWNSDSLRIRIGDSIPLYLTISNAGETSTYRYGAPRLRIPIRMNPEGVATVTPAYFELNSGEQPVWPNLTPLSIGSFDLTMDLPDTLGSGQPGEPSPRTRVAITGRQMLSSCTNFTNRVGKDLAISCSVGLPSGVRFSAVSSNPSILLVSDTQSAAGSDRMSAVAGSSGAMIYAQALTASGTATITLSADGYEDLVIPFVTARSAFILSASYLNLSQRVVALDNPATVAIVPVTLDTDGSVVFAPNVGLRVGAPPAVFTMSFSSPNVATATPSTITFAGGDSRKEFTVTPIGTGSTVLTVAVSGGYELGGVKAVLFEVKSSVLPVAFDVGDVFVPRDMERILTNTNAAAAAGIPISISSSDPARLQLALPGDRFTTGSISTTGMQSITLAGFADNGTAELLFQSQGYLPVRIPVRLTAALIRAFDREQTAAASISVQPQTSRYIDVMLTALGTNGDPLPVSATEGWIRRRGLDPLTVTIDSSAPSVGRPDSSTISIPAGQNRQTATRVQFVSAGSTTIRAAASGTLAVPARSELTYVVASPEAAFGFACASEAGAEMYVGQDLMSQDCKKTGTAQVTVTAVVDDPSVAVLSFDNGRIGATATTAFPSILQVHGLRLGTTTIRITAPGFPALLARVNVVSPFLYFSEPASGSLNLPAGVAGIVKAQIRVPAPGNSLTGQVRRPESAILKIAFSTSGSQLVINNSSVSEMSFFPRDEAVELRVQSSTPGVSALRLNTPQGFGAVPPGFRTEVLVTVR